MESGKVLVNDVELFYEKQGSSEHVVLCIPGALGSTRTDFAPQLEELSKNFTVVAIDLRGCGKSIPPERNWSTDVFHKDAEDAAALMLKLGFSKFSVLGWSDGGLSSLIMAVKYPELIRKMVVWGSGVLVTEENIKILETVIDVGTWHPKMRQPLLELYGWEYLQRKWTEGVNRAIYIVRHNKGNNFKEELEKVKCPLLIIHGLKDDLCLQINPEHIHKTVPGSKLHLMAEGGHNLHLKYPQRFNKIVTEFLIDNHISKL